LGTFVFAAVVFLCRACSLRASASISASMASPSTDIEWCDALLALGAVDMDFFDEALDLDELFLDGQSSRSDIEWCDDFFVEAADLDELFLDGVADLASPSQSSRSDSEWCDALWALGAADGDSCVAFFFEALDLDDALLTLGAVDVLETLLTCVDFFFEVLDLEALDFDELFLDGVGECMRAARRWRSSSRKCSVSALNASHASASLAAFSAASDVAWDAERDAVE